MLAKNNQELLDNINKEKVRKEYANMVLCMESVRNGDLSPSQMSILCRNRVTCFRPPNNAYYNFMIKACKQYGVTKRLPMPQHSYFDFTNADEKVYRYLADQILKEGQSQDMKFLCDQCKLQTKKCKMCEYRNCSLSISEAEALKEMQLNITEIQVNGERRLQVKYLFKEDPKILFPPEYSNKHAALQSSLRLYRKLVKMGQLKAFNDLIRKEMKLGFVEVLSKETEKLAATLPIFFSSVNIALNIKKQKFRFVNNHSFSSHRSGSINEQSLVPPSLLNDPILICLHFLTFPYVTTADIEHAYKNLYTDEISNNLRCFMWLRDLNDEPGQITEADYAVYRPVRLSFGSTSSGTYLDLARIQHIAKQCETPEGIHSVNTLTFVDDFVFSASSPKRMATVQKDIQKAYGTFGFGVKEFFSSYHGERELKTSTFLGNEWRCGVLDGKYVDEVKPALYLSVHERYRNIQPLVLTTDTIKSLVITRKVASRLLGVLFSYTHSSILPLITNGKLLYHEVCRLTQSWTKHIADLDQDLNDKFMAFLHQVKDLEDKLQWTDRCVLIPGRSLHKVIVACDAGVTLSAALLFYVAKDNKTGKCFSRQMLARNKISKMSVIKNELFSLKIGVDLLNLVMQGVDLSDNQYSVSLITDSMAATHFFSPTYKHRCILTNNVVLLVRKFMQDCITANKNISRVQLAWHSGESNIADKCTKFQLDPVGTTNSHEYKYGPKFFLNDDYPGDENVFFSMDQSGQFFYKALKIDQVENKVSKPKRKEPNPLRDELASEMRRGVYMVRTFRCCHLCQVRCFNTIGAAYNHKASVGGVKPAVPQAVSYLPKEMYDWLLGRYSRLRTVVNVYHQLSNAFAINQFAKRKMSKYECWLKLLLSSQVHYLERNELRSLKAAHVQLDNGLICVRVRVAVSQNKNFIDNFLVPYVSDCDKRLLYLILDHGHIFRTSLPYPNECHRNKIMTKSSIRNGDYPVFLHHDYIHVKKHVDNCLRCNKANSKFINQPSGALRFFHNIDAVQSFQYCSIDVLGPGQLKNNAHDRRRYKVYYLVLLCLVTQSVSMYVIDGYSKRDVLIALATNAQRHGPYKYIMSDAGRNLVFSQSDGVFMHNCKFEQHPASAQRWNTVESSWRNLKLMLKSMTHASEKLTYPTLTYCEMTLVLDTVSALYNNRIVASSRNSDDEEVFISPALLTHTYFSGPEAKANMDHFFQKVDLDAKSCLDIIGKNAEFKQFLVKRLKEMLISNNQYFLRKYPKFEYQEGDVVLVRRGQDQLKLAHVIDASPTSARLQMISHNAPSEVISPTSILVFLYRSPSKENKS